MLRSSKPRKGDLQGPCNNKIAARFSTEVELHEDLSSMPISSRLYDLQLAEVAGHPDAVKHSMDLG